MHCMRSWEARALHDGWIFDQKDNGSEGEIRVWSVPYCASDDAVQPGAHSVQCPTRSTAYTASQTGIDNKRLICYDKTKTSPPFDQYMKKIPDAAKVRPGSERCTSVHTLPRPLPSCARGCTQGISCCSLSGRFLHLAFSALNGT